MQPGFLSFLFTIFAAVYKTSLITCNTWMRVSAKSRQKSLRHMIGINPLLLPSVGNFEVREIWSKRQPVYREIFWLSACLCLCLWHSAQLLLLGCLLLEIFPVRCPQYIYSFYNWRRQKHYGKYMQGCCGVKYDQCCTQLERINTFYMPVWIAFLRERVMSWK